MSHSHHLSHSDLIPVNSELLDEKDEHEDEPHSSLSSAVTVVHPGQAAFVRGPKPTPYHDAPQVVFVEQAYIHPPKSESGLMVYEPESQESPKSKENRICGLKRSIFWLIFMVILVLLILGLGLGLGIALSNHQQVVEMETVPLGPQPTRVINSTSTMTSAPQITPFALNDNYYSLTMTRTSSEGELCNYFFSSAATTTTLEAQVFGDMTANYTATWSATDPRRIVTATGAVVYPTDAPSRWEFTAQLNYPIYFNCRFNRWDKMDLNSTYAVDYNYQFILQEDCTLGDVVYKEGDACDIFWFGEYN